MFSTFSVGTGTPLYFSGWLPLSVAAYSGTCLFLIALAGSFRILIYLRSVLEGRRIDAEFNRRYVVRTSNTIERTSSESDSRTALLTANGVEKDVMVVRKKIKGPMPWSIAGDGARAATDTAIAAVFYLLMLAIMTMNVGYFLSVLGGTFLGSLVIGRYTKGAVLVQTLHA